MYIYIDIIQHVPVMYHSSKSCSSVTTVFMCAAFPSRVVTAMNSASMSFPNLPSVRSTKSSYENIRGA